MSKIQINDLDDLNVEQFATLTDLESAGIQGGLTVTQGIAAIGIVAGASALAPIAAVAVLGGVIGIAAIDIASSLLN